MARGCSADGSVIYGSTWDNLDYGMLYWKDGKVDWVGSDVREVRTVQIENGIGEMIDYNIVNGMICTAELTNISPNGRWIAGTYRTEDYPSPRNYVQARYPAFFNTETGTTTIVKDFGEGSAAHVTDDGLGIILVGTFLPSSGHRVRHRESGEPRLRTGMGTRQLPHGHPDVLHHLYDPGQILHDRVGYRIQRTRTACRKLVHGSSRGKIAPRDVSCRRKAVGRRHPSSIPRQP